jgi:IS1 family transposase
MANILPIEKKILVLSLLTEGQSIRATQRITGVDQNTIMSLLVKAGQKAQEILDREMVNLECKYIQVDEIWNFVFKKQKQCTAEEKRIGEVGDQFVFVAMDSESKIVPSFLIGKRSQHFALQMMKDLQYRIKNRFQLSTDSFKGYPGAVDEVFGDEIDFGMVHKEYRDGERGEKRYSPAQIVRMIIKPITGNPKRRHISTSHIERQNLTMRMQMRRFTRLTNGFSKKLENLKAATALHFYHYNFMRIHSSLRVTPAMEAKVTKKLWGWEDLFNYGIERKAA